jgi:hypothetical protein
MTKICPQEIFDLFKNNDTKSEGRRRSVEWMTSIVAELRPGDKLLVPDPETGEPTEMEMGVRKYQS